MATQGWEDVTEADIRRMGRQGSKSAIRGDVARSDASGKGHGTPESAKPQKRSKYRAIPCIVTEDLTLFTSEDIAQVMFAAGRHDQGIAHGALKYRATLVGIHGIWFGSLKEGRRYIELAQLQTAGEISQLLLQPVYRIMVKSMIGDGDYEEVAKYVGDFQYETALGAKVVEDTKGVRTPAYKLKRKIVERLYGIKILET